ncbi:MAG: alpha/beta hydrolase [Gammaproteobacteria bacterium]|nr:alpha/beta hydrolase [Gammaproteobacteria bacterium]
MKWKVPEPLAICEAVMDDGTAILLRRYGNPDGMRIVLSHANGLAVDCYYPFWSLLTERFDLVVFDFRNHGWNAVGRLESHTIQTFVSDISQVADHIKHFFGPKQIFGVFHSMSAQTAMLEACSGTSSFDGLVLFDPFICPRGCDPDHKNRLMKTMRSLVEAARRRRSTFESLESFAERMLKAPAFDLLRPGVVNLIAQTTTRPAGDGSTFVLRCPPEYEARIGEQGCRFASSVDVEALSCPVKVIGSDPVMLHSYMPTVDLGEILALDYDFVPDTTHFLQLEQPEACISAMLKLKGNDGKLALAA